MRAICRLLSGVSLCQILIACQKAPLEQFQEPLVKIEATTIERLTADSLLLTVKVSEQKGQLKRETTLANKSSRPHTVSWYPFCDNLIWLLLDPANPMGPPRFNASIGVGCNLTLTSRTIGAGESMTAPEWNALTRASRIVGDSLPAGTYLLGVLVTISDLPALLQIGSVEFLRP